MTEKTGLQTVNVVPSSDGVLPRQDTGTWFDKVREMRRHPTIAMVRDLAVAPALASPWSYESTEDAPEDALDFITEVMNPARLRLLRTAMLGCMDFGWQSFEKCFYVREDKKVYIHKFKPLLQDLTEIMIDLKTGAFDGLLNHGLDGSDIELKRDKSLLFSIDVEGTDWYGNATLRNAESSYDEWKVINAAASRYDKRIAGAMWVVHYPIGTSMYDNDEVSNDRIADIILNALESSGAIKVPRQIEALSADLNEQAPDAWKIELLTDGGAAKASFIDRQAYLDKLMIRAFSMPERAIIEGQFGTKAEAEAHADFAITNIELQHALYVQDINWHVVNQLLRINYGEQYENTVFIATSPLSDPHRAFLKETFAAVMGNPEGFIEAIEELDVNSLLEKLDLPVDNSNDIDE